MFSLEKYLIASASPKHSYLWGRKLSLAWHYFSSLQVLQLKSGFHSQTIKVTARWFKQKELFICITIQLFFHSAQCKNVSFSTHSNSTQLTQLGEHSNIPREVFVFDMCHSSWKHYIMKGFLRRSILAYEKWRMHCILTTRWHCGPKIAPKLPNFVAQLCSANLLFVA